MRLMSYLLITFSFERVGLIATIASSFCFYGILVTNSTVNGSGLAHFKSY